MLRRCNFRHILFILSLIVGLFFFCEFIVYYFVLWHCHYPEFAQNLNPSSHSENEEHTLRAMFVADTHLLGSRQGHWFDKLRREWQMHRAFQTAMTYFRPEVIFFLGDIFDEGKWCDDNEFHNYRLRFDSLFSTSSDQKVVVVAGNHDIGFHYAVTPYLSNRFNDAFHLSQSGVELLTIKGSHFVLVNSMAMHGDKCNFCIQAEDAVNNISKQLSCMRDSETCQLQFPESYSRPILLQHFPLFRQSDEHCHEPDEADSFEKTKPFRPLWDCLSRESSQFLLKSLTPRLILSGHTHHGCRTLHRQVDDPSGDVVPEWSVSSFSWRNRNNPAFILSQIRPHEFVLNKCYLPEENSVIDAYKFGGVIITLYAIFSRRKFFRRF